VTISAVIGLVLGWYTKKTEPVSNILENRYRYWHC